MTKSKKYKSARLGDHEVSTYVEKYPIYYLVRHKNETDSEPIAFLVIESEEADVGYPTEVAIFMRKNYLIKRTTKEEAETYSVIGVAPIMTPIEFAQWLSKEAKEIAETFSDQGIKERNGVVRKGNVIFDMSDKVTDKDLTQS